MPLSSHDLFRKYPPAGPRYNSYPIAPDWMTSPSQEEWLQSLTLSMEEGSKIGRGVGLYIHIPFCESLCTYCGCNTRVTRNHSFAKTYISALLKEWEIYLSHLPRSISLGSLTLGGGTPTFLTANELDELIGGILSRVSALPEAEFSVEIDPRVTTPDQLEVLWKWGFRKLSMGVEDLDPRVQEIVNRVQPEAIVRQTTETARALGFTSVHFDLIYGLPLQDAESIQMTLDAVGRLRPDRIAYYGYVHAPWIKAGQRKYLELDLPTGEDRLLLYQRAREGLRKLGYYEVGMDQYCLPTDSLWKARIQKTLHRNFTGYLPFTVSPLIGLGVSGIGDSWTILSQNEKILETYQARVERGELPLLRGHVLSAEDQICRERIFSLMTQMNVRSIPVEIRERLSSFYDDGLMKDLGEFSQVTERGVPFLRNICAAFDPRRTVRV